MIPLSSFRTCVVGRSSEYQPLGQFYRPVNYPNHMAQEIRICWRPSGVCLNSQSYWNELRLPIKRLTPPTDTPECSGKMIGKPVAHQ